ncbi:MAG: RHS repeat-associated core domain-containing protein [Lachnospiraceae bacterium]|nr:RHS repeat-associated core domain-containing protein [Lachnospiraceae bacterium]
MYDVTSNLYYLRTRYMNPSTGTFISMDTYEGSIYDPDTLHKYMYANGNPVTYSDPSGNFASAVGGLVATTINTVMNNFQTLNAMGIISGLTNSAITAFLGGSDMEIGEAFFKGYVTGFGLGAVLYVAAAYDVIVFAKMYLLISASNVSMSVVMTIASVIEKKERETLVYGTLAILSLLTLADAYSFNCMVNVIGDKGSASIGWEYNNSEIQGNNTTGTKPDTTRINLAKGRTRFTPTRANGNPVSAGMEHVEKGHFNRPVGNSRSVFSISIDELKAILQRKDIINCAVSDMGGGQYVRIVNTHRVVGNTALKYGGEETTWIEIITDVKGNIITTYPVPEP